MLVVVLIKAHTNPLMVLYTNYLSASHKSITLLVITDE